ASLFTGSIELSQVFVDDGAGRAHQSRETRTAVRGTRRSVTDGWPRLPDRLRPERHSLVVQPPGERPGRAAPGGERGAVGSPAADRRPGTVPRPDSPCPAAGHRGCFDDGAPTGLGEAPHPSSATHTASASFGGSAASRPARDAAASSSDTPRAAAADPPDSSAEAAAPGLRLGKPGRRQAVLLDRRDSLRPDRHPVPALL